MREGEKHTQQTIFPITGGLLGWRGDNGGKGRSSSYLLFSCSTSSCAPNTHHRGVTNKKTVVPSLPPQALPFTSSWWFLGIGLTDLQGVEEREGIHPCCPAEDGGAELPPHRHLFHQSGESDKECVKWETPAPAPAPRSGRSWRPALRAAKSLTRPPPTESWPRSSLPVHSSPLPCPPSYGA